MATSSAFPQDPRRRNLAILAAAALVAVLLALFALHHQVEETSPNYAPREFLPGLAAEVGKVAKIHVQSKKNGAFDVDFTPAKGWVLAQRGDYPASFVQVQKTLVALAALTTIEPKTARTDWLSYLDLGAPADGGNGTLIALSDEHGKPIASLIVGKSEDIGDATGAIGLFVRKSDESQSWLVRSIVVPSSDPADWMEKNVLDIDRARIAEVDVAPRSGPPFQVRRDQPGEPDFKLANIPPGRELAEETAPDGVAAAIVGFAFDDVRPLKDFDFGDAAKLVRTTTRTFDGLVITVKVLQQGQDSWAAISADAASGHGDAAKEAGAINARTAGWAYKLPAYKGAQFMTTLESLLKPAASKGSGAK